MQPKNSPLIVLCLAFVAITAALHLYGAKIGWLNLRDQHLSTAITYARGSIDLLHPMIVGFNAQGTPTPQELPLWQAAAALAFKLFGPWWGWANVVSLLAYFSMLWPLFRMAADEKGARYAWWTLLFFVAQPISILNAGMAATDGFSLATATWFLYFAVTGIRTKRPSWFVAAALMGCVAAVSKLPFFMAAGIAAAIFLLATAGRSRFAWLGLIASGAVAGIAFLLWTKYTDSQVALAEFPLVELRLSKNPDMRFWYFGDWAYRLSPGNWLKGGWRMIVWICGSIGLAVLPLLGLGLRRSWLALAWVAGGIGTTLVFSHLVLHHGHYYLMFAGGVAMLCAQAFVWLEEKLAGPAGKLSSILPISAGAALLLAAFQGLVDSNSVLFTDPSPREVSKIIQQYTTPGDKLVIQGGGWGGLILMMTDRTGLSVWNTDLLEKPETRARLKALGYTKLVMISESPLLAAVQESRPGGAGRARELYTLSLTPEVKKWPALFETPDLLIKQIP